MSIILGTSQPDEPDLEGVDYVRFTNPQMSIRQCARDSKVYLTIFSRVDGKILNVDVTECLTDIRVEIDKLIRFHT